MFPVILDVETRLGQRILEEQLIQLFVTWIIWVYNV